jgi:four helix bundle protein
MNSDKLKERTKRFALDVIQLLHHLPRSRTADVIGKQLLRSATSVGANYRSACKARSRADFISKITIVEEEADECQYWVELLIQSGIVDEQSGKVIANESKELTAIFTAAGKTARRNR